MSEQPVEEVVPEPVKDDEDSPVGKAHGEFFDIPGEDEL